MSRPKKKRAIDGSILNQSESAANHKVRRVYNLKLEDFASEGEFDGFLEEREQVIYNLVHNIAVAEADELLAAFKAKYHTVIERRNAENLEKERSKRPMALPLMAEVKIQSLTKQVTSHRAVISLTYSDRDYIEEIDRRLNNWQEKLDVPRERAGGMSTDWIYTKAKQELRDSMIRPR
jgi:hypothetical protein